MGVHIHTPPHTHTYIRTCVRACMRTHTCMHAHTPTYTHTCTSKAWETFHFECLLRPRCLEFCRCQNRLERPKNKVIRIWFFFNGKHVFSGLCEGGIMCSQFQTITLVLINMGWWPMEVCQHLFVCLFCKERTPRCRYIKTETYREPCLPE